MRTYKLGLGNGGVQWMKFTTLRNNGMYVCSLNIEFQIRIPNPISHFYFYLIPHIIFPIYPYITIYFKNIFVFFTYFVLYPNQKCIRSKHEITNSFKKYLVHIRDKLELKLNLLQSIKKVLKNIKK